MLAKYSGRGLALLMETTTTQFKGYAAKLTNHEGQQSNCWVINSREINFNDGTRGLAFKVRPAHRYLVQGGHRYAESYGTPIWVKAARVSN